MQRNGDNDVEFGVPVKKRGSDYPAELYSNGFEFSIF
jgi:hypothetical protein